MALLTIEHDSADATATKRTRRRTIALRLDGKAWLRVEPEALGELGVADGDEVDDARRVAVEETLARVRARLFVLRSLAVRMQSTAEIENKLAARDIPPEVAKEAIERVAGYGYIDDASLAGQLARGMRSRGYGRRRAEQKLRSRGLPGSLADAALDDAYGGRDEAALAREALGRRPVTDVADRRRAIAFLARRGFSAGAAWKAVREAAAGPAARGRVGSPVMPTPAHYAVCDGLLAGAYPGTSEALEALEREGVILFVDLTHPSDPLDDYGHLLRGARRLAHPIPDMGTPAAGYVIRILDDIDEARTRGSTAYVHCWGGVGRTGTVIGCWLVRHGLDEGDPIARIAELRAAIAGERPSPETPGQVELVRSWRRGR